MNLTRRRFLQAILFAGPSCAAYARYVEPEWLSVDRVTVPFPRARLGRPLRILHISDLHVSNVVPARFVRRAVECGLQERPDIACITGDFITDYLRDASAYAHALKQLAQNVPTFACLGNHDGGQWAATRGGYSDLEPVTKFVSSTGIRVLQNQSYRVTWGGQPISLVGLADYWSGQFNAKYAFADESDDTLRVALSHNPDSKTDLRPYPWDLMLSGHTHGGQVIIPLVGPPFAPVADMRFLRGLHTWENRQLYVTRGVGNLHGIRFACRPEISILDLVPT